MVDSGTEGCLSPAETLALPHAPWDVTFDSQSQLWVLLESEDVNVLRAALEGTCMLSCGFLSVF